MNADVITLPRCPSKKAATEDPRADGGRATPRWREAVVVFSVFAMTYLAVAWLMLQQNIVFPDALSRVANAFYVLYSRDPHLPAVGFVWNPLPSLVLLPLLPLKALFPVLVERGFAGNIQSALTMAATVAALATCLRKLGVTRSPRLLLTVLFGLQPMIVLYAGSGLSEPMLLWFLMLTVSALISWVGDQRAGQLVLAGLALGLAYLTRYEAVAPAIAVAVFVGAVTFRRSVGPASRRGWLAINDVVLVAAPFAFAFLVWAATAKVLVGEWFPTFTSGYGNASQVAHARESIQSVTGTTVTETLTYISAQIHGLTPLIVPLLIAALILGAWQRRAAMLVAPLVLGAVLAFVDLVFLSGASFGWLRFQIAVIPLAVLVAGSVVAAFGDLRVRPAGYSARVGIIVGMIAVGLPIEARTLTDTSTGVAREESEMLRATFLPQLATGEERESLRTFLAEREIAADLDREIAADLDRLALGEGAVLTDAAYAYPIVLGSTRPTQFVITSDFDFKAAVANPAGHGITYLLVPEMAPNDALRQHWPTLYEDGAGIAVLVKKWPGAYLGEWRLYRVR